MMLKNNSVLSKKAFGGVASTLILFVAVIGVSTGLVIMMTNYVSDTQDAMNFQNSITTNKLKSAISISNIYYNDSSNQTFIYVKNIGENKLNPTLFDLYLDNSFEITFSTFYADNLSKVITLLQPQETLALVFDKYLASGTHSVKVLTEYSSSAEESFNI